MGNAHPPAKGGGGIELQRRAPPLAGVKRSNLYAEQGRIGDEGRARPVINLG